MLLDCSASTGRTCPAPSCRSHCHTSPDRTPFSSWHRCSASGTVNLCVAMTTSLLLQVISVVDQEALVCPLTERLLCGSSPPERSVLFCVRWVGLTLHPACCPLPQPPWPLPPHGAGGRGARGPPGGARLPAGTDTAQRATGQHRLAGSPSPVTAPQSPSVCLPHSLFQTCPRPDEASYVAGESPYTLVSMAGLLASLPLPLGEWRGRL